MIADIQKPDVVASIIEKRHHSFRKPRARDAFCARRVIEALDFVRCQFERRRPEILFEIAAPLGAGYRYDVRAHGNKPRQRHLARRRAVSDPDLARDVGDPHIVIEVRTLDARIVARLKKRAAVSTRSI